MTYMVDHYIVVNWWESAHVPEIPTLGGVGEVSGLIYMPGESQFLPLVTRGQGMMRGQGRRPGTGKGVAAC